jgi:archaellum biogenesis ATPase FlaH
MNEVLWRTSWKIQFADERDARHSLDAKDLCKYGITCLDDALTGIFKNDLVVLGADSGVGKSELCLNIARTNAKLGKKVVLFYLEGGEMEAMRRMKWRDIIDIYYKKYTHTRLDVDYGNWVSNTVNDPLGILKKIEDEVLDLYMEMYKNNLIICPISNDFGVEELKDILSQFYSGYESNGEWSIQAEVDLVLIDHLQYFSLPEGENEIASVTKILRECKHITDKANIPIVLVSHLRKKKEGRGLPSQDDFYGTSNIPKISSTAITICPDYDGEDRTKDRYPTFFRIAKSRIGVRSNLGIRAVFNLNKRSYEDNYEVFKLDSFDKPLVEPLSDTEKPRWARKTQSIPQQKVAWDE